ncbi:hypothetical protein BHM03_00007617 [Ensete ventricosum]|nr:hypothetical protein BHM03_00007617 [Ensete ventricosum]
MVAPQPAPLSRLDSTSPQPRPFLPATEASSRISTSAASNRKPVPISRPQKPKRKKWPFPLPPPSFSSSSSSSARLFFHLRPRYHLFLSLLCEYLFVIPISILLQLGEGCSANQDCDAGLRCDGCDGDLGVCVRIRPYDPRSKVRIRQFPFSIRNLGLWGKDLPFNKYSWLTTHNSFADAGAHSATGATLITFTNQQDNITSQLNVRFLALSHVHFRSRFLFPARLVCLAGAVGIVHNPRP